MNLETIIDGDLWTEIRQNYEVGRYTEAIKDSFFVLSDLIREKANLEGDGVALVGQAFGGQSPRIKVTKLESQSDKDIQAGTEAILRGIYQSIRNPRSHEKYSDSQDDTDAIIVFINYLIGVINKSRAVFSLSEFLPSVFDANFVATQRYANLLVAEIPAKFRMDVMVEVLRKKEEGDAMKLHFSFYALMAVLTEDEKKATFAMISDELRTTSFENTIRTLIRILEPSDWLKIDEIPRLRIENRLIESIRSGHYVTATDKCVDGALGTWAPGLFSYMTLREEALLAVLNRLRSPEKGAKHYGLKYFSHCLPDLADSPPQYVVEFLKRKLNEGDQAFFEMVESFSLPPGNWLTDPLKEALAKFQVKGQTKEAPDDIPF